MKHLKFFAALYCVAAMFAACETQNGLKNYTSFPSSKSFEGIWVLDCTDSYICYIFQDDLVTFYNFEGTIDSDNNFIQTETISDLANGMSLRYSFDATTQSLFVGDALAGTIERTGKNTAIFTSSFWLLTSGEYTRVNKIIMTEE